MKEIYAKAVEDSFLKLKASVNTDILSEDFIWDLLIEMLIVEESPLAKLFSVRTLQLAELHHTAKHLATVADDIDNHDNDIVDESVGEEMVKADEEVKDAENEVFADFEDI